MIATHRVTTSGMSRLSAARDVMTVPANSAKGTAYCSTIRFRVGASFDPKSCRHAATKPSRKVTTIGRSAFKIVSSNISLSSPGQNTIDHRAGVSEIVGWLDEPFDSCMVKELGNFRIVRQKVDQPSLAL